MRLVHVAAFGTALVVVSGCSHSSGPSPRATTAKPSTAASPSVAPSGAASLTVCPRGDAAALALALPGTSWSAGAAAAPSRGVCVVTMTRTDVPGTLEVTYAPSSTAASAVAAFQASPPPLPNVERLTDLGLTVPAAGAGSQTANDVAFLIEAAKPTLLVSLETSLPTSSLGGRSHHDVAKALISWALSLQILGR